MTIVEQIHQEFYTASEKIVAFAIPAKARKLHELGFTSCEDAKAYDPEREKLRDLVLTYQMHYPNNKFITDVEVERICKKYNLICGPVSAYTGKVPDDKVEQIASFKLNMFDVRPSEYLCKITYHRKRYGTPGTWLTNDSKWHKILPKSIVTTISFRSEFHLNDYLNSIYRTEFPWLVDSYEEHATDFTGLFICAPEKEMKLDGLTRKGVFAMLIRKRVIKDPVVLHPCKGGFLIVAAWGPEASDNDVVNPKMN